MSDDNVCLALQLCKCIFVPTDVTWIQLEVKHLTVGATVKVGVFMLIRIVEEGDLYPRGGDCGCGVLSLCNMFLFFSIGQVD